MSKEHASYKRRKVYIKKYGNKPLLTPIERREKIKRRKKR